MNWLYLTLCILVVGTAAGFLLKKWFPWVGRILLCLMIVYGGIIAVGTMICWDGPEAGDLEPSYGVMLGYALEDGQASEELLRRCAVGKSWLDADPDRVLIVSGGDPGGQGRTEAEVMAAWLRNHGVEADRILIEDQASDTRENLLFSKALAEEHGLQTDLVLIITSEYHQTRAMYFADQVGQQAMGISAKTPMPDHLFAAVREVYAILMAMVQTG